MPGSKSFLAIWMVVLAMIGLATLIYCSPTLQDLGMLDDLRAKVRVPQKVIAWTRFLYAQAPEAREIEFKENMMAMVRPPWDAFQNDQHECDQFLVDVMEAIGFRAIGPRRFAFTPIPRDQIQREGIEERTREIKDYLQACLVLWRMRSGSVTFHRIYNPNMPITGF